MEHLSKYLLSWASILDDNTCAQVIATATMPFIHPHLALMPDAPHGAGRAYSRTKARESFDRAQLREAMAGIGCCD